MRVENYHMFNYFIKFNGHTRVYQSLNPSLYALAIGEEVHEYFKINGFRLISQMTMKELTPYCDVQHGDTIHVVFSIFGGMLEEDDEEGEDVYESFEEDSPVQNDNKQSTMTYAERAEKACEPHMLQAVSQGTILSAREFLKINKTKMGVAKLKQFYEDNLLELKNSSIKEKITKESQEFNARIRVLQKQYIQSGGDMASMEEMSELEKRIIRTFSESTSVAQECRARRKQIIKEELEEVKDVKGQTNNKSAETKSVMSIKKAVEGKSVKDVGLIEQPKTEVKVNKVYLAEAGDDTGSGLGVLDVTKPRGLNIEMIQVDDPSEDEDEQENKNSLLDAVQIPPGVTLTDVVTDTIVPEKSLGSLKIAEIFSKNSVYIYDYATTGMLARIIKIINAVRKYVCMAVFGGWVFSAKTLFTAGNVKDFEKGVMGMVLCGLISVIMGKIQMSLKGRHTIRITDVTREIQRPDSEKREADNNFQTTKVETKAFYTETAQSVLGFHAFGLSLNIPYNSTTTDHVASAELVSNMLTPIIRNSGISNSALMERMSKATNLGSYVDYDRADSFQEDLVNGSERLAVGVAFHQRCLSLPTHLYEEVFQTGSLDKIMLLPRYMKKRIHIPPTGECLIWTTQDKTPTPGRISTAIELTKSVLKSTQSQIIRVLPLLKRLKPTILPYATQCVRLAYIVTSPPCCHDLTYATRAALSTG